jgi:hypothetical protein
MAKEINVFTALCASVALGLAGYVIGSSQFSPKQAVEQVDLNGDGFQDLVIEQVSGKKVPLYGLGIVNKYLSAEEMLRLHSNSTVDYKTIESKLNE